jgi:Band 3 cytoplasmic domain.
MRKIPPGAEASNILVGEVDFLEKTLSAFIRLNHATFLGDLTEVPVPTRFLFILLGPAVSILRIMFAYSKLNKGSENFNFNLVSA